MLTVKTGYYHPCLEDSFAETVRTLKKDDPLASLAVVSPTNWMQNRLQERLVLENNASFMNIRFMNFYTLALEICKRSGTDVGHIVRQPIIYEYLIEGLLRQQDAHEPFFQKAQSLPALAQALFRVIQDLSDANVHADDLLLAIKEGFMEGAETRKLSTVAFLYGKFRQRMKELNLSYYSDVFHLSTPCIADSGFLKGFSHILAYGFYDLTGVEQDFFGEIFRSHPTTLFLPYQKNHPAFSYVKPFFESVVLGLAHDIEDLSSGVRSGFSWMMGARPKEAFEEDACASAPQTKTAKTSCTGQETPDTPLLQAKKPEAVNAPQPGESFTGKCTIINASGKRDEVWTVAKEILRLAGEGYRMEEIGVVARTLEPYTDAIKKIFHENYIPFTTTAQEPVGRYPLAKAVRQLLLLKRENYYRPMVMELLGSPYLKTSSANGKSHTPRPDLWDLLSRRLGICGGIESWLARIGQAKALALEQGDSDYEMETDVPSVQGGEPSSSDGSSSDSRLHAERYGDEEAERRVHVPLVQMELLETILRKISNDLSSLPEQASWIDMGRKVIQLIQNYIHIPTQEMEPEGSRSDALIMDKMVELLCSLQTLDCLDEEVTFDQFVDAFIQSYQREGIPIGLENGRGVKVLDAMSARGIPFRALFLLGLNEKVFPRAISEEPFLRDHVRRRLSEVLGNYIPEKLYGFDEERLLFFFLLNAARERVYLLYERSDEAGKPRSPSHYVMDVLQNTKSVSSAAHGSGEGAQYDVYVHRGIKDKLDKKELSLLTPKEVGIRMALNRIDPAAFFKAFGTNPRVFRRSEAALAAQEKFEPLLSGYDGMVGTMAAWLNGRAHRGISPTALEVYGECPFKYFMGKVLELASLEEPELVEMLSPGDLGILYHNILRDFYHALIEKKYFDAKRPEIAHHALLHDVARRHFEEVERRVPIPYPIVWEIKKEEILAALAQFTAYDLDRIGRIGYIPAYLERTIKASPPGDVLKENPRMVWKGTIDRIDLQKAGDIVRYRIIDYKSGKFIKENLIRSAIRGQRLQIPFYIVMAEYLLLEEMQGGRIPRAPANLEEASFIHVAEEVEDKKGGKAIPEKAITGADWKDIEKQCWATVKEFLHGIREGMFPVTLSEDAGRCDWCDFAAACRKSHQPARFRLERDARLDWYREIIKKDVKEK